MPCDTGLILCLQMHVFNCSFHTLAANYVVCSNSCIQSLVIFSLHTEQPHWSIQEAEVIQHTQQTCVIVVSETPSSCLTDRNHNRSKVELWSLLPVFRFSYKGVARWHRCWPTSALQNNTVTVRFLCCQMLWKHNLWTSSFPKSKTHNLKFWKRWRKQR